MDEPSVLSLTGQVSLQLAEAISAVSAVLCEASTSVSWLKDTDRRIVPVSRHCRRTVIYR